MHFAGAVTYVRVVTMHHNKDTQEKIIVLEATAWAFWIILFSLSYLLLSTVRI
jgi:hypothetical protein